MSAITDLESYNFGHFWGIIEMESFFSADSYDEDLMMDQVYNAMKISDASSLSFGSALCISRDPAIINRTYAVEWIKKVTNITFSFRLKISMTSLLY